MNTCVVCSKEFNGDKSLSNHNRSHNPNYKQKYNTVLTEESKRKISISKLNENNPMWKSFGVGMTGLHKWIKSRKIKPQQCEKCGIITNKLDLANISQEYKRDINDFEWLCRKCHMLSDGRLHNLKQFQVIKN